MFCHFTILIPEAVWGQTGKTFFSEEGYVTYHIMQLKCLTLCNPPPPPPHLLGWVKQSDIEIVQISIG